MYVHSTPSQSTLLRWFKTKKAFQVFMLPERLLCFEKSSQVLLGSGLLSPGQENAHSVSPGNAGRQVCAHKHRDHLLARQLLMRIFPNLRH